MGQKREEEKKRLPSSTGKDGQDQGEEEREEMRYGKCPLASLHRLEVGIPQPLPWLSVTFTQECGCPIGPSPLEESGPFASPEQSGKEEH